MQIINKKILEDIKNNKLINLNLGSGNENLTDYYNCDIKNEKNIDIVCDLNNKLDLIPDNTVANIYSNQTFEHINNLTGLISEIVRISSNKARCKFIVPHFANPYYYSDPTHVRQFGLYTFHYFVKSNNQWIRKVPNYLTMNEIELINTEIIFYRNTVFENLFNPFIQKIINLNRYLQDFYEKKLCWIYPPSNLIFEIKRYLNLSCFKN